jgi:hypothetical protein
MAVINREVFFTRTRQSMPFGCFCSRRKKIRDDRPVRTFHTPAPCCVVEEANFSTEASASADKLEEVVATPRHDITSQGVADKFVSPVSTAEPCDFGDQAMIAFTVPMIPRGTPPLDEVERSSIHYGESFVPYVECEDPVRGPGCEPDISDLLEVPSFGGHIVADMDASNMMNGVAPKEKPKEESLSDHVSMDGTQEIPHLNTCKTDLIDQTIFQGLRLDGEHDCSPCSEIPDLVPVCEHGAARPSAAADCVENPDFRDVMQLDPVETPEIEDIPPSFESYTEKDNNEGHNDEPPMCEDPREPASVFDVPNEDELLYIDEYGIAPEDQYNSAASVPFFNACSANLGYPTARLLKYRLSGIVSIQKSRH